MMPVEALRIDNRFRGPPNSGNGGYVCGLTARHLTGTVTVRLKAPPPLETDLRLESTASDAQLFSHHTLIATATTSELELQMPPMPSYEQATVATESFPDFRQHPFPGCFVCGPQRVAGDGLCIFPGLVPNSSTLAAPWIPDGSLANSSGMVQREYLWSALDCPGAFAVMPSTKGSSIVLGELCTSVVRDIPVGETCVVYSWPIEIKGRKRFAGSAIGTSTGEWVAKARAIWIEIQLDQWQ